MTRAALAATVSAAFAAGGILALGQPAGAAPNTRTATVAMDCAWQTAAGGSAYGEQFVASPAFELSAPGAAQVGGKAELSATVKDSGNLLTIPAGATAHILMYTGASMDATVSGAAGLAAAKLATASDGAAVGADGVVKAGAFTQSYSVSAAGSLTVQLDKLTVSFTDKANGDAALNLVCTPRSASGVWPAINATSGTPGSPSNGGTLQQTVGAGVSSTATPTDTATAKPTATLTQNVSVAPTTTASASGTTSGSGSTSSGPLAHTGGGGPGLMALAMLAASLLLGSIAVILALPNRRKSRPLT
ncbi:MAG: hypothetical protein HOU01_15855 [Streptomycetaceae bacterium]|nr:hypothetical protein [Streptomycetaceae bacterium]